jgi:hypothetical protein
VWENGTGLMSCDVASGSDASYEEGLHFSTVIFSALISSSINIQEQIFIKHCHRLSTSRGIR